MTPAQLEQVGTWEGTSVDVGGIEGALNHLWKEAGQHDAKDARQPPARTSVMNLVVYVPGEEDAARAIETVATLTGRHPSRTIVVVADPTAPTSSLDASVSGQCTPTTPAYGRLCWEQITIKAHGATAVHAPGVVIPLLLADLPTYLWWAGDAPFGTELFRRMVDLCDRLIVDSRLFARPIDALGKLTAFNGGVQGDRGVSDFHWMRLTPWCNLTAQFFDGEELRPYVYRIETVRIGYAGDGKAGSAAQALLLAGWLTSCLGWTPRPQAARLRGDALHLEAERTGTTVTIDVAAAEPAGADPGDVVSLELAATLRDVPAVFRVERRAQDSEATTTTTVDGTAGVAHTVRMATRSPGELLCEELEIFRHDRSYEAALGAAAALCRRIVTEEGR